MTNLEQELRQFSGTERYYKHRHQIAIGTSILLTDGIKYLCDTAQCYWLIDLIASYQPQLRKEAMLREFQFWEISVNLTEQKGYVQCWEDRPSDYSEPFVHQDLDYTDFPLAFFRLYGVYQEKHLVIMLPSEY